MRFSYLAITASALLGAAACGGKVVVDGDPSKVGVTGGTTSMSTSMSTSASTAASTASGSSDPDPLCLQLCEAVTASGCAGPECVGVCTSTLGAAPECHDAAKAAASCIQTHAADFPGCTVHVCDEVMSTYEACATASKCSAALVGGGGDDPICIGKGVCGNGGSEWSATCDEAGSCQCRVDTTLLGTCQEAGPFLCDFLRGCCEPFFLQQL